MPGEGPLLSHFTDSLFGDLTWDEDDLAWKGRVEFLGRQVVLWLDPTLTAPTREDQIAIIETCRATFQGLPTAEPALRRAGVEEIGEALFLDAGADGPRLARNFVDGVLGLMEPAEVYLHGGGQISYQVSDEQNAPRGKFIIRFEQDLSFGESEVLPEEEK